MKATSVQICVNYIQFLISTRYLFNRAHDLLQRLATKTTLSEEVVASIDALYIATLEKRRVCWQGKHLKATRMNPTKATPATDGKGGKSGKGGKGGKGGKKKTANKGKGNEGTGNTLEVPFDRVQLAIVRGYVSYHRLVTQESEKYLNVVETLLLPLLATTNPVRVDVLGKVLFAQEGGTCVFGMFCDFLTVCLFGVCVGLVVFSFSSGCGTDVR
jgi:hypothetical protein